MAEAGSKPARSPATHPAPRNFCSNIILTRELFLMASHTSFCVLQHCQVKPHARTLEKVQHQAYSILITLSRSFVLSPTSNIMNRNTALSGNSHLAPPVPEGLAHWLCWEIQLSDSNSACTTYQSASVNHQFSWEPNQVGSK